MFRTLMPPRPGLIFDSGLPAPDDGEALPPALGKASPSPKTKQPLRHAHQVLQCRSGRSYLREGHRDTSVREYPHSCLVAAPKPKMQLPLVAKIIGYPDIEGM